jgi:TRAP-type C4-dicarboxylate transport system permease small subunit
LETLLNIRDFLARRAENILSLLLFSVFATFLVQVAFRYLLNLPLGWTVEWVAIAWLWSNLFGFAFVTRDEEIIRLDIIYGMVPAAVQRFMDVVANLVCAGIFIASFPAVLGYVTFMDVEKTAYMQLPFSWVFSIYIPFMLSVIIRCLLSAWQAVRGTHPKYVSGQAAESHEYD